MEIISASSGIIFFFALFVNLFLFIFKIFGVYKKTNKKDICLVLFCGLIFVQISGIYYGTLKKDYFLAFYFLLSLLACSPLIFLAIFYKQNIRIDSGNNLTPEKLLKQLPGHVYWKDKNGIMLGCNDNNWKDFGLNTCEEMIGKSDFDVFPNAQALKLRQTDLEVMKSGCVKIIDEDLTAKSGETDIYLSHKIPLKDKDDETIGILGVSLNITEARKEEIARLKFLENILAEIPGHIFWKDKNGIFLGCNHQQAKTLGLSSWREVIGKTTYDMIWHEQSEIERHKQAEMIDENDRIIMNTGKSQVLEEPLILPDGSKAVYLSKKTPLKNDQNEIIGILGIAFDVTELRRTKFMLENILNTIPGHVFWKDKNYNYLGCNDSQANSLCLKSREDIEGKNDFELSWKEQAQIIRAADTEVIKNGVPIILEEIALLADGRMATFLSKKAPLRDQSNEIIGVLGVSIDVTEHKKTEQQLRDTRSKLEGMTLIASIMAHELRTPLSAFAFAADGVKAVFPHLKQAYLTAKENGVPVQEFMPGYLEGIEQSLMSMDKEVRAAFTFIDMALLNSDPQLDNTQKSTFSISECIDEALSRYPFHGQRKLVRWQPDPNLDFAVAGDKLLVIHVLFNLIKNALYYVAAAGKGEIHIWLERQADFNKLYFKDTGAGIDAEIIPRIFDRFYSRTYHGAGIGLTFCKSVLVSLGGDIACASEKHHYTMFTLSFPVSMVKPRL